MVAKGAGHACAFSILGAISRNARFQTMPYVQSAAFEKVAYDEERHVLRATFRRDGHTEAYQHVPQDVYDGLIFAASMSDFFDNNIQSRFPRFNDI